MKINITKQTPDDVGGFFSGELAFAQKVVLKKLGIVEQILERMEALGLKRGKLADKMEVSPARVTTMLNGTNNFTIETMMRAAEAVGGELSLAISPKGHEVKWISFDKEDIHVSFLPSLQQKPTATAIFSMEPPVCEDYTDAA